MAKTGKKAELDKDGIQLPDQKEKTGKGKAELDKDGLGLASKNKADLDKDGLNLASDKNADLDNPQAGQEGKVPSADTGKDKKKIFIIAGAAAGLVLVLIVAGGLYWHHAAQKVAAHKAAAKPPVVAKRPDILNENEIALDPFMVLFSPQKPGKAGLLVAEMNLTVNPRLSANVKDKTYEIRSLISDTLAKNAQVYTQFEVTEMLKEALRPYDVLDVTFTRYELR